MENEKIIQNENESKYNSVKIRVQKLKEFYSHLVTYLIVNSIFFTINMLTNPNDLWFLFPLIGWGICLTFHSLDTFAKVNKMWDAWEEKKIKELSRR